MPISATSADAASTPPWGAPARASGLLLDYGSRDRGPFRAALLQAAATDAALPPADPVAIPVPAAAAPAPILEGADALAALSRDLAGGAVAVQPPTAAPGDAAPATPGATGPAGTATDTVPGFTESWRNDEIKGRRLGDRPVPDSGETGTEVWLFGEDGFGFDDLVDIVNPLQHIPVVSSLYRWITGDEIAPAASIAGGAVFGGPLGAASAVAGVAIEEATGRDLGEHAIAMMFGAEAAPAADLAGTPRIVTPMAETPPGIPPGMSSPDPAPPAAFLPRPAADAQMPAPQLAGVAPAVQPTRAFAGGIPASGLPAIGAPVAFIPAASAGVPDRPAADDGSPADAAIATQMMDALDKYEALVRARVGSAPSIEPAAGSLHDSHI